MVTPAAHRQDKYKAKLHGDVIGARYDATKPAAVRQQKDYFARAEKLETQVKQIINGTSSMLQHFYIAYAEELSSTPLNSEREIVYCKWLMRGLDEDLLKEIGRKLYDLRQDIVCPEIPPPPPPLLDSLLHYYKLDEVAGVNAEDSAGANDGTANNARVFTSAIAGIINTGADFTQGNDYIDFPVGSNIRELDNNDISVSLWFKSDTSQAGNYGIIGNYGTVNPNPNQFWHISVFDDDTVNVGIRGDNAAENINLKSTTTIRDNAWYHIVFVKNGTNLKLYINNTLEDEDNLSQERATDNNLPFSMARHSGRYTDMIGDEIGLWNRNLLVSEVSDLWNGGAGLAYPFS